MSSRPSRSRGCLSSQPGRFEVLLRPTAPPQGMGRGRLIAVMHSSLPLWGTEHYPPIFPSDCSFRTIRDRQKQVNQVTMPIRQASACMPRLRKPRPVGKTKYSRETKTRRICWSSTNLNLRGDPMSSHNNAPGVTVRFLIAAGA